MHRNIILASAIAGSLALFAAETGGAAAAETAPASNKSIVPNKYGNKYKNGGSDSVADFINDQCTGKDKDGKPAGFEYTAFFALCRANGLAEDYVAKYEEQVATGARGTQGRARMTLGNSLRALARKNGKLVGLDGKTETELAVAKAALSGAAAKAAEGKADAEHNPDTDVEGDVEEEAGDVEQDDAPADETDEDETE